MARRSRSCRSQNFVASGSPRGDIVIDPFLGSGSTLIAGDKTDRVCCGVDPLYVDVIVRRYQAATAEPEVLDETASRSTRWRRVGREAASEPAGDATAAHFRQDGGYSGQRDDRRS